MLRRVVGGIDPGQTGGLVICGVEPVGSDPLARFRRSLVDAADLRGMRGEPRNEALTRRGLDYGAFTEYLRGMQLAYDLRLVCIERQQIRETDGAVSGSAIVAEFNGMVGVLVALGIPFQVVTSQSMYASTVFERRMCAKRARELNARYKYRNENKPFSVAVCERFLDGIDFGKGKPNDGVADAGCYALHAAKVVNS